MRKPSLVWVWHNFDLMQQRLEQLSNQVRASSDSMLALEQAANNIVQVLDTIRGVAEQTNLLALNAAIEAARAGVHGPWFCCGGR